jgi:hypothetical protein
MDGVAETPRRCRSAEMTVAAAGSIVIEDVLVGEVWVGSGQSNVKFVLSNAVNRDKEIAHAVYPLIHLFHVKRALAEQPAIGGGHGLHDCGRRRQLRRGGCKAGRKHRGGVQLSGPIRWPSATVGPTTPCAI